MVVKGFLISRIGLFGSNLFSIETEVDDKSVSKLHVSV